MDQWKTILHNWFVQTEGQTMIGEREFSSLALKC
jgi:hypothetical protein